MIVLLQNWHIETHWCVLVTTLFFVVYKAWSNYSIEKEIIQKYLVFIVQFSTQIGSKQASLFVLYKKQLPFLKSNNVEYC